jgi:hypothetical protein
VKAIVHLLRLIVLVGILQVSEAAPTNSVSHLRLRIKLYDGWRQATNTNGPATFYRGQSDNPLQISWASIKARSRFAVLALTI